MGETLIKHRKTILKILAGYIAFYMIGIVLIDILNVFNAQRLMVWYGEQGSYYRHEVPLFWYALKPHGSLTELVQWFFLSVSLITLWQLIKTSKPTSKSQATWFKVWFAGLVMLFLEDTINTRHHVRRLVTWLVYGQRIANSPVGIATEVIIYSLMGVLMVLPLIKFRHVLFKHLNVMFMLLIGYGFYGLAGFFSATRHVRSWYVRVGDWFLETTGLIELSNWALANQIIIARETAWNTGLNRTLGYYIMDYIVEETFELIGAGLIAFSLITLLLIIKQKNNHES